MPTHLVLLLLLLPVTAGEFYKTEAQISIYFGGLLYVGQGLPWSSFMESPLD